MGIVKDFPLYPVRRKPLVTDGTNYIRIKLDGQHQRMGSFGNWYDITPVVYKLLQEQGFKEWDRYEAHSVDRSRHP